jgi:hypothetical protein
MSYEGNPYNYDWEEQHDNKETHPRMGRLLKLDLGHGVGCDRCNQRKLVKIEEATRNAGFYRGKGDTNG